ncbi:hypothetical protein APA_1348 [Pseudanabaena sp. lw0831]|uniref:HEAT repeat domain-containing protein n=1 Tax=Pseudanabaena sp. lw0831 TaxID=1357935 RepID=UPI0019161302|nr:hypothetical protein [Pseudanabaena sp. lw0831]GBO53441.1 hypothetical protein APA_1348 [Pseudanabaena sp. lw0831]
MNDFTSYYWTSNALPDESSIEAFQQLISEESNNAQKIQAFLILLKNNNPVAQGIAFDYFFYFESLSRYGFNNLFSPYLYELLVKAREQLNNPPIVSIAPNGTIVRGANHASALGILAHLGEEEDIDLITNILESSHDPYVVFACCLAAQRLLGLTKKNYPKIISSLTQIIYEKQWSENVRIMSVRAFANYEIPEIEDILVSISRTQTLPISAYAAVILGHLNFERYRNFLQELSANWTQDIQYPASEVLDMLEIDANQQHL